LFWNLSYHFNSASLKDHCLWSFEIFQWNPPAGSKILILSIKGRYIRIEAADLQKKSGIEKLRRFVSWVKYELSVGAKSDTLYHYAVIIIF
jgi:hypothetical protein